MAMKKMTMQMMTAAWDKFHRSRPSSGIELIGDRPKRLSEWTQDELAEFVERVTAGDLTFRQYA